MFVFILSFPATDILARLIAVLVGHVEIALKAKCVEAGFNSYVTKPVDFKELSVQMNKFLDPDIKGRDHDFMKNVKG